ncbi:MAG TPA: ABC transporter ATP-binding protein [Pseudonocardia sp.]
MTDAPPATARGSARGTAGPEPLIGAAEIETPYWAQSQLEAARAGTWTVARGAPRTAALLLGWSWRAAPRWTLLAVALQLATAVATTFGLLSTVDVFTNLLAAGPTPQRVVDTLPALAVVVVALVARGALQAASGAVQARLVPRIEERAQDEFYSGVAEVELAAFDDPDFTALTRRAEQALVHLRWGAPIVGDLAAAVVSVGAAVVTAGLLHPVLAPLALLAAVPQGWAGVRGAQLQMAASVRTNAAILRRFVTGDLLSERENAAELRAFTARDAVLREHRRIAADLADDEVRVGLRQNRVTTVGRALSGLGTAVGYTGLGLLLHGSALPLALAGTAVLALRTAGQAITTGIYAVNRLFQTGVQVEVYRSCLADLAARRRPDAVEAPVADPATIALDDVSFRYPGQEQDAVAGVSLTLRRGQVVALVGENGSGKTTLAKLVTGLYLPTAGTVAWDGLDTARIAPDALWERVAVVMQEPLRWPVTAENNVRIGRLDRPDPDGATFADATARSGADAVFAELPGGLGTMLSKQFQGGRDLSGGQWQRISVARGLYRDAPVVVADEPTAAMDARAEHAAFAALRSMSAAGSRAGGGTGGGEGDGDGRITVLVTHRLANVRHADQIVVLEHGRVAAVGTHDELMARGGTYQELFSLQAGGYTEGSAT